jgi:glucose-6-phosphate 1-dehydrogenase
MLLAFDSVTAYLSQGGSEANRIFYLSVPQECLLDVASSLASNAQTQKGWNRIIIEKPFGFDALSSHRLTQSLLTKFEEKQIYRLLCTLLYLVMYTYVNSRTHAI